MRRFIYAPQSIHMKYGNRKSDGKLCISIWEAQAMLTFCSKKLMPRNAKVSLVNLEISFKIPIKRKSKRRL